MAVKRSPYPAMTHTSIAIHANEKLKVSTKNPNRVEPMANPIAKIKLTIPSLTLASRFPKTSLVMNPGADM